MRSMRSKSVRPMWMKSIECCGCRSPQRKAWTERAFCHRGRAADGRKGTGCVSVAHLSEAISYTGNRHHYPKHRQVYGRLPAEKTLD